MTPLVQPLSYRHRNLFFYLLVGIFATSLPFLFLYASGYRFSFTDNNLVSTGGLYVAVERTGAEIFINDELVRETRVFRRAFYAQGLPVGTHKVHVNKVGYHTWVKELPVYAQLVTEAQAFNLPIVPEVRLITEWTTPAKVAVLTASSSVIENATPVNQFLLQLKASTSTLIANPEYQEILEQFVSTSIEPSSSLFARFRATLSSATSTLKLSTTTKEWQGVKLYKINGEVFAQYIGQENTMPYYYCALPFAKYEPATTTPKTKPTAVATVAKAGDILNDDTMLKVQTVSEDTVCEPTIKIDVAGEPVSYFDFFPNSTDLVLLGMKDGIYVIEIDDRAWQNKQPLLLGEDLEVRVINGAIYVFDGTVLYQVVINQNWF